MNGTIKSITDGQDGGSSNRAGEVQDEDGAQTMRQFNGQTVDSTLGVGSRVSYEVDGRGNAYNIVARN